MTLGGRKPWRGTGMYSGCEVVTMRCESCGRLNVRLMKKEASEQAVLVASNHPEGRFCERCEPQPEYFDDIRPSTKSFTGWPVTVNSDLLDAVRSDLVYSAAKQTSLAYLESGSTGYDGNSSLSSFPTTFRPAWVTPTGEIRSGRACRICFVVVRDVGRDVCPSCFLATEYYRADVRPADCCSTSLLAVGANEQCFYHGLWQPRGYDRRYPTVSKEDRVITWSQRLVAAGGRACLEHYGAQALSAVLNVAALPAAILVGIIGEVARSRR